MKVTDRFLHANIEKRVPVELSGNMSARELLLQVPLPAESTEFTEA